MYEVVIEGGQVQVLKPLVWHPGIDLVMGLGLNAFLGHWSRKDGDRYCPLGLPCMANCNSAIFTNLASCAADQQSRSSGVSGSIGFLNEK